MPLHFIKSQKGADQLLIDGFLYRKTRQTDTSRYWICILEEQGCRARCVTTPNDLKSQSGTHNHTANPAEVTKRRKLDVVREAARTTLDAPSMILAAASVNMPVAVAEIFPTPSQVYSFSEVL